MLSAMVQAEEQDLWLILVNADIVTDLDRPDLTPFIGLADAKAADDVGFGISDLEISALISA